jgi:hypothetical protein
MKVKTFACLVACALIAVTQAMAAPIATPFLSVDINGANYGGGQTEGPTEAGFQSFRGFEGFDQLDPNYLPAEDWGNTGGPPNGLTKTFPTSAGNITANLIGVPTAQSNRGARNRGANTGGQPALYQDFVFAQRNGAVAAHGRNFIKLVLSGLIPNQLYEFTGFAREPAFNAAALENPDDPGQSYQAWTDLDTLGGVDGPAAWLDANVGVDASYNPIWVPVDHDMDPNTPAVNTNTGYKNPIPTRARSQVAGPDSLSTGNPYFHSASFFTKANGSGAITIYTWSDPNGFGGTVQGASLLNGFQLGIIPEPGSLLMFGMGLTVVVGQRRRIR